MKTILIEGDKTFKITVPDDSAITFGPWSPPKDASVRYNGGDDSARRGTLRIYAGTKSTANILAVFSGVKSFRDLSIGYSEMVAREEGASLWKSDENGYEREERGTTTKAWVPDPAVKALPSAHSARAAKAAATRAKNKAAKVAAAAAEDALNF